MANVINWLYLIVLLSFKENSESRNINENVSKNINHIIQRPIGFGSSVPMVTYYPHQYDIMMMGPQQSPGYHLPLLPGTEIIPGNIQTELKKFIFEIVKNNKLYDIPLHLLEIFLRNPDLENYIKIILESGHFPQTVINPKLFIRLLYLLKRIKNNEPINEFPISLLVILLNLEGTEIPVQHMLEWLRLNKTANMMNIFLDIIKRNGGLEIPRHLQAWLMSFPNGKQILQYLQLPGEIICKEKPNGSAECIKNRTPEKQQHIIESGFHGLDIIPENIQTEVEKFILEIVNNHRLYDIPLNKLNILINNPNLEKYIKTVLESVHIPQSQLNSKTLIQLFNLLKNIKNNQPINEFPVSLLDILFNLQGTEVPLHHMLEWLKVNKTGKMMDIFLDIINRNGGKEIPRYLQDWLISLPNGQEILQKLRLPGEIMCTPKPSGDIECIKKITSEIEQSTIEPLLPGLETDPDNIRAIPGLEISQENMELEIKKIILGIVNHHRLYDIPSNLLDILISNPNTEKYIKTILESGHVPQSEINSKTLIQLFNLLKSIKNNQPLNEFPLSLLEKLFNLKGTEIPIHHMLEWLKVNKTAKLMDIFLDLIKINGGKEIPVYLQDWLMSLPNGKQIIQHLQLPGEIMCLPNPIDDVQCVKKITSEIEHQITEPMIPGPEINPVNIKTQLKEFILEMVNNQRLHDIPLNHLDILISNPNLDKYIKTILDSMHIPQSNINSETIIQLFNLLKRIKKNEPINEFPIYLLDIVSNLQGTDIPVQYMLEWLKENKTGKMMDIFLDIIKRNGGKEIPRYLQNWLLSLPNGQDILQKLRLPGEIVCMPKPSGDIGCIKKVTSEIEQPIIEPVDSELEVNPEDIRVTPELEVSPENMQTEIKNFISGIVNNHRLYDIPSNLLDTLISNPNSEKYIKTILDNMHIPQSNINSETIIQLFNLLKRIKNKEPINEFPISLLDILSNLQGTEIPVQHMLEWLKENKTTKMMDIFLDIIKRNGGKEIPRYLQNWLLSLPNGQDILQKLRLPGEIVCIPKPSGDIGCIKKVTSEIEQPIIEPVDSEFKVNPEDISVTPELEVSPKNMQAEIKKIISGIVNSHRLYDIPSNLLDILISNPNSEKYIKTILDNMHIPQSNINSETIIQLFNLLKRIKNNEPIKDFPISLLDILSNLKGTEIPVQHMLEWLKENKTTKMMDIFLDIIKRNGGKEIPRYLQNWLLSLPNGQDILQKLRLPGEIVCIPKPSGDIGCIKKVTSEIEQPIIEPVDSEFKVNPEDIRVTPELEVSPENMQTEIENFISGIVNNHTLYDIPSNLLDTLISNPNSEKYIKTILDNMHIPQSNINSETIIQLFNLLKRIKNKEPINEFPISLLEILSNLQGTEIPVQHMLEWLKENKTTKMMDIFLDIINRNDGKQIPRYLQDWILSLPNGQEILYKLRLPGETVCKPKPSGDIGCIKRIISETKQTIIEPLASELEINPENIRAIPELEVRPENIQTEIKKIISGIVNNHRLYDIPSNILDILLTNPNSDKYIKNILDSMHIPQSKINSETIIQLFSLLKSIKNNQPLNEFPVSLLEILFNLEGTEIPIRHILEWLKVNKTTKMMDIILDIIAQNGGKHIPRYLYNWLMSLPNGKQIIQQLRLPGDIICKHNKIGEIKCIKKRIPEIDRHIIKLLMPGLEINSENTRTIPGLEIFPENISTKPGLQMIPEKLGIIPGLQIIPENIRSIPELQIIPENIRSIPGLEIFPGNIKAIPELQIIPENIKSIPGLEIVPGNIKSIPGLQIIPENIKSIPGLEILPENIRSIPGLQIIPENIRSIPELQIIPENIRSIPGLEIFPGNIKAIPELQIIPENIKSIPGLEIVPGNIKSIPGLQIIPENIKSIPGLEILPENIRSIPVLQIIPENIRSIPGLEIIPKNMRTEIKKFIFEIVNNHKLYDMPLNILDILISNPNLEKFIKIFLENGHIQQSVIDSKTLIQLFNLMQRIKNNQPLDEFPTSLLQLLFNLKGTEIPIKHMLEWLRINKSERMMHIILDIIHRNGGKIIPAYLLNWLRLLPNGNQILQQLRLPGEIICWQNINDEVECLKNKIPKIEQHNFGPSVPDFQIIPENIKMIHGSQIALENMQNELKKFIFEIVNNHRLYDISSNLLNNMISNPNLERYIHNILESGHIPRSTINSKILIQLFNLLKRIKNNEPIIDFPIMLLEILFNLQGTKIPVNYMLEWLRENKLANMMHIFVDIIMRDENQKIPEHLREWILSLPDGKLIIEYLSLPGEIKCTQKLDGDVECIKLRIPKVLEPVDLKNKNFNVNSNFNFNNNIGNNFNI